MLIAWNAIAYEKGEFLRDENGVFIPRNEFIEAIESALVFYLIKKDKALENTLKSYILKLKKDFKIKSLAKEIKKKVFEKYPIDIIIDEKVYLPKDGIKKTLIKRFDFEQKEFVEEFQVETFKGVIEDFTFESSSMQLIKNALVSYARALADIEHKELKETFLEEHIIELKNLIANEWDNTLRVGRWTKTPYKGDLLFFWKVKEVRQRLLRDFKIDIRPKDILFIPKEKEFLGWCELKN